MSVVRFGVSLEKELLDDLDDLVTKNRFTNRSQAIQQLIADHAALSKWQCNNLVVGSITLVYNHHKRELMNMLNEVQHAFHEEVLTEENLYQLYNTRVRQITEDETIYFQPC